MFEAEFSAVRIYWTKCALLTMVVDDLFDNHACMSDLYVFLDAVKRPVYKPSPINEFLPISLIITKLLFVLSSAKTWFLGVHMANNQRFFDCVQMGSEIGQGSSRRIESLLHCTFR